MFWRMSDVKRHFNRGLTLILSVSVLFFISSTYANPEVGNIASGNASIQQTPTSTIVNQSSQKAIINWNSFNIGANESTHFQQPAGGITLNRISGSQGPSSINGRLTATGQLILINPAGIFLGKSAYVNVGGLVASTANMSDHDFLTGNYHFSSALSGANSAIINEGQIIAAKNGLVALLAPGVVNNGVIQAELGHIVLASGKAFTIEFSGNSLISFSVDEKSLQPATDQNGAPLSDGVKNTGSLLSNGGSVLITAKSAAGVLDNVINVQGIIEAKAVNEQNGEIILSADPESGIAYVNANLDASGHLAGQLGGNIHITGYNILLDSSSILTANGDAGGGHIFIGGNAYGTGPLPHANATIMAQGATISADALTQGNGGNVVLWSNHYTKAAGNISVKGGNVAGNGGFVETSSSQYLNIKNLHVNATAPHGATGIWLLDPTNIYIATNQSNATAAGMSGTDSSADTPTGVNPQTFAASGAVNDSLVTIGSLTTALSSANVIISTTNGSGGGAGNITVVDPISWSSANSLTLSAANNINVNNTITASNGSLTLSASGTITLNGSAITTGGSQNYSGSVALSGSTTLQTTVAGNISMAAVNTAGFTLTVNTVGSASAITGNITSTGGLTKAGSGTLTLSGSNTYSGATTINAGTLTAGSANAFSSNSRFTLANVSGAILDLNDINQSILSISGGGASGGNTDLGSATLTWTDGGMGETDYSGIISGTGNIVAHCGGTSGCNLRGTNTFTGTTTINGGQLNITSDSNLGTPPATPTPNHLIINSTLRATVSLTVNANRGIRIGLASSGGTLQATGGDTLTYNGIITGTGTDTLTKFGAGTVSLGGANTYSGPTSITNGILAITSAGGLGSTSSITTSNDGQLDLINVTPTASPTLTLGTTSGSGLIVTSGTSTYNGNVVLSQNTSINISSGATLNLTGTISSTGTLTKSGTGTLALTGSNTYTNVTTVSAGTLSFNSIADPTVNSALGAPTAGANSIIALSGSGTLIYTGSGHSSNRVINLTSSGATIDASGSGTLTLSGGFTGTATNLILTGTNAGIQSGVIATTSGTLTKNGTGSWTLSNTANTYTGQTSITEGTLSVAALANGGTNSSLGATAALTPILLGSTTEATLNYTGGTVSTNRTITIGSNGATIQADSGSAQTLTLTGAISSTTGTLTLVSGSNNITMSNTSNVFPDMLNITNANHVTLAGTGTINFGNASISGNLAVSGDLIKNNGGGLLSVLGTSNFTSSYGNDVAFYFSSTHLVGAITINGGWNLYINTNNTDLIFGNVTTPTYFVAETTSGTITQLPGTTIDAPAIGAFTAPGNITLTNANNLLYTQFSGANVSITTTNNMVINYDSSATGSLALISGGSIDGGSFPITATGGTTSLTAGTGASGHFIYLPLNNDFANLTINAAEDVTVNDINAIVLNASSISNNLSVTTAGAITQTGALTVGGTSSFTVGSNAITLTQSNAFTGAVSINNSGANNVSLTNGSALILGTSGLGSGTLGLTVSGSISQTGALTATGAITITENTASSDILLTESNNLSSTITFAGTLTNIQDLTIVNTHASATLPTNFSSLSNLRNLTIDFSSRAIALPAITLTSGGSLSVTAGGAITQSAALIIPGTTTLSTGSTFNVTLNNASNNFIGEVSILSGNNITLVGAYYIVLDTSTMAGNLNITANGSITQIGAINMTTSARTLTLAAGTGVGHDITLTDSANVIHNLNITSANDVAISNNTGLNFGPTTISGNLTVVNAGVITNSGGGTVSVAGTSSFTAGSSNTIGFYFYDTHFVGAITVVSGFNVRFPRNNTSIVFGNVNASSYFYVGATGDITQLPGTTISYPGLGGFDAGSSNNITLNQANSIHYVDLVGNNVILNSTGPLVIPNAVTVTNDLTMTANGNIGDAGSVFTVGGIATLTAGSANSITLSNANNNFATLQIVSANNATITDINSIILGTSTISGNLSLTTGGSITQSGALTTTGTTTITQNTALSDILLTQANNLSGSITFAGTLTNIQDLTIVNTHASASLPTNLSSLSNLRNLSINFSSAAIALPAITLISGGSLSVTAGGAITQSAALIIPGTTTLSTGTSFNITLSNASNNFTGTVSILSGNSATLVDTNAIILGTSTLSNTFSVTANGSITNSGIITTGGTATFSAGAGNSITLNSPANAIHRVVISNSSNFTLSNSSTIQLGNINVTGAVNITSTLSSITQNNSVTSSSLITSSVTGTTLNGFNHVNSFSASNSTSGNILFNNLENLNINGITLQTGGNLTITNTGSISQTAAITVPGTSSFSAGNNAITLTTSTNSLTGNITLSNSNLFDVQLTNNVSTTLATSTIGRNLTVITSNDAISQTGVLTVGGTSSFTAGANTITLTQANALTGAVSLNNSSANNVSLTNSTALILATSNLGSGSLNLTVSGSITQSGALTASGATTITQNTASSDTLLTQANNLSGSMTFAGTLGNIRDLTIYNTSASASLPTNLTSLSNLRHLTLTFTNQSITLPALTLATGGSLSATVTGALTTSGVITTTNGHVSLTTLSPDTAERLLTINAAINSNGGNITLTAANNSSFSATPLVVNAALNTQPGSGGSFIIGGGTALNATPVIGAGNITLDGNGLDLTLGTINITASTTFSVNRFITVNGALTSTLGAHLGLQGDKLNIGTGGVYITSSGSVASSGNLNITGSNLNGLSGANASAGIDIKSTLGISAAGALTLVGNVGNSNIVISGPLSVSGANNINITPAGTGIIQLSANISSQGGNITFAKPLQVNANVSISSINGKVILPASIYTYGNALNLGPATIVTNTEIHSAGGLLTFDTIDDTTDGTNNLTITSGTGSIQLNGAIGAVKKPYQLSLTSTGTINPLTISSNLYATNHIYLTSTAGSILETGAAIVSAPSLTTNSGSNTTLNNANTISTLNVLGGNIVSFTNVGTLAVGTTTAGQLTITGSGSSNTLSVNRSNALTWNINSNNAGTITNVAGISGTFNFSNIQNITGNGSNDNTFTFTNTGAITGTINPGSLLKSNILDFTNYGSAITINLQTTNSGAVVGLLNYFDNITAVNSNNLANTLGLPPGKANTVSISGAKQGFVNDPIYFTGIQNINNTGGGNSTIIFTTPVVVNAVTGAVTIGGVTMQFGNFATGAFTGNVTMTTSQPVANIVQQPIIQQQNSSLSSSSNNTDSSYGSDTTDSSTDSSDSSSDSSSTSTSVAASEASFSPVQNSTTTILQGQVAEDVKISNNMTISTGGGCS